MSAVSLRLVEPDESELIFSFLTLAARMAESGEPIQKALSDKQLTKYWQRWGQPGDLGVVAVRDSDGVPISCAWLRQLSADDPCFVAEGVLELAIGTIEGERNRGVGRQVLARLVELARERALGISLSVRADNPAVRLYQAFGFGITAELTNRVGTRSLSMLLRFQARQPAASR